MYTVPESGGQAPGSGEQRNWGMPGFTIIWVGQLISLVGSAMTMFALTFWAWQLTGKATALAMMGFFGFAPAIIVSPFAGALVDRWNRKLVMMLSDLATGMSTIIIFILYSMSVLQIWHLYVLGAFASVFQAFQWPAYSAAISTMLPKKHYGRANGMISMAEAGSGILAPVIAGVLLAAFNGHITPILIIDIVTFSAAIGSLLVVPIPQPKRSSAGAAGSGSLLSEAGYGFRYILARPSLLGLQLVFFAVNLAGAFQFTLLNPMILARTNSSAEAMGTVQSAFGIGGLIGGLLLSVWGGPKRKVHGVLIGMMLTSFFGGVVMGLGQTTAVWAAAAFGTMFVLPVLNGSNQAIWQAKVPPDVQGRVFSVRRLIAQISSPLAIIAVGPLADYVFEPRLAADGAWAGVFGSWVGTGPGAGIALMMVISGVVGIGVGLGGYLFKAVRDAETLIPDHDEVGAPEPSTEAEVLLGELQPAE